MSASVILDMLQDTRPGRCVFCDQPLGPPRQKSGRKRTVCGDRGCWRVYHRLYAEKRRAREKEGAHA